MSWSKTFSPDGRNESERREQLRKYGLSLDVTIKPDEKYRAQAPGQLATHSTGGLIDTGATTVCIDYQLAQRLNLREINQTRLIGVDGNFEAHRYVGILEVPELEFSEMVEMVAPKVSRLSHDVILGRSFLSEWLLTFDWHKGMVHFAKPSPGLQAPDLDEFN